MSDPSVSRRNHIANWFRRSFLAAILSVLVVLSGCSYIVGTERLGTILDRNRLQRHPDRLTQYRLPQRTDVKKSWKFLAERGAKIPWKSEMDLNGDGRVDYAYLLTKRGSRDGVGLWVFLSEKDHYEPYRLIDLTEPVYCCGIRVRPSGRYGVLTDDDGDGSIEKDIKTLDLDHPAVEFVVFEKSARLYYWNPKKSSFSVAWTK